jgi:hypothetical protein
VQRNAVLLRAESDFTAFRKMTGITFRGQIRIQKLSVGALVAMISLVCRTVSSLPQNPFEPAEVTSATNIRSAALQMALSFSTLLSITKVQLQEAPSTGTSRPYLCRDRIDSILEILSCLTPWDTGGLYDEGRNRFPAVGILGGRPWLLSILPGGGPDLIGSRDTSLRA